MLNFGSVIKLRHLYGNIYSPSITIKSLTTSILRIKIIPLVIGARLCIYLNKLNSGYEVLQKTYYNVED